jgi:ssDNA-binding Zn-finger/Zn-ribbon topoisomerase 1
MKCKKCGGLMVLQAFFDHFLNFDGWKCLNCGKIILRKEKSIEFDAFSVFYQQSKCRNRN